MEYQAHNNNVMEKKKKEAIDKKRADLLSMEDKVLKVIFNLQDFAENRVDNFTLNEGEYNELSKELATQYQQIKTMFVCQQNTIRDLLGIVEGLRETDWYKKNTGQPYQRHVVLSQEEKLRSDNYSACHFCDSWIKKGKAQNGVEYMSSHQKRGKCKDIQLGREQSVTTRRPRNHSSAIVIGRQLERQAEAQILRLDLAEPQEQIIHEQTAPLL